MRGERECELLVTELTQQCFQRPVVPQTAAVLSCLVMTDRGDESRGSGRTQRTTWRLQSRRYRRGNS